MRNETIRTSPAVKPLPLIKSLSVHIMLIVGAVVMLYPLLWMISGSLKPEQQIFTQIGLWPSEFHFDNYIQPFVSRQIRFGRTFTNSFTIVVAAVIGNIISTSMTAFAFGRLQFKFKKLWFTLMLLTIMLPPHVTLISQYMIFHTLGWVNTFLPLIVPKFLAVDAFFVFLMVQFIRTLPPDLDNAAEVDGCSPLRIYFHITLPLLGPALITTSIFTFVWTWDDFFSQLIYLNTPKLQTVPLALRLLANSTGEGGATTWGPMLAMATLSIVPIFIVFLIFQKYLVEGIATTGLKG